MYALFQFKQVRFRYTHKCLLNAWYTRPDIAVFAVLFFNRRPIIASRVICAGLSIHPNFGAAKLSPWVIRIPLIREKYSPDILCCLTFRATVIIIVTTQHKRKKNIGNKMFARRSKHEASMKQMYWIYTCTTCALSLGLLHVCFIV